jgi:NitT/TauT family transport system substrate-binding protein
MNDMNPYPRRAALLLTAGLVLAGCAALLLSGCNTSDAASNKVKVAYLGLTCEAPIFAAYENDYFKEEGLEPELVKTDWDGLREGLNSGQFDANHTLIMYLLLPIEKGNLDAKITGGIHTGCLRVQAGAKSDIKTVKDLKGKTIGVPTHLGSPPYLFACRVLAAAGIDPNLHNEENKDIQWRTFPPDGLAKALEDGRIDAVATSDPIGTILLGKGLVKTIADQAEDPPYNEEYCCAAVVSGKLAKDRPAIAAKVTRALLKGAKWVGENPKLAAQMSVDKKYIASSVEINEQALLKLKYIPAVAKCRKSVTSAAVEMKQAGLLQSTTDPVKLTRRAWMDLDGVTDEWVNDLKVGKSSRPRLLNPTEFAALFEGKSCCGACCCIQD